MSNQSVANIYSKIPGLVFGFHGTNYHVFNDVIHNHKQLEKVVNDYHWLGQGVYFWEQNLERAYDWADKQIKRNIAEAERKNINLGEDEKTPAVIGAIIDLQNCLNLLDKNYIDMLPSQYKYLTASLQMLDVEIPVNTKKYRRLDCAVIDWLCSKAENSDNFQPFDSVRGMFIEGEPIYDNSGFFEESHIQICIRNMNCIKGYFSPIK